MVSLRAALTFVLFLALLASSPTAAPKFSDWSAPVNLGPLVNSSSLDAGPTTSKDGSSLYFNSNRPGGVGANDIWVSQWDTLTQAWGIPTNLGAVVNSAGIEAGAALSRDEHWLFFQSNRPGGFGALDIWVSYRRHTHDDFGWEPPVNVGPGVNSAFEDTNGAYFENDDIGVRQLFFASNRPGGLGQFDIYVSELLPDDTFGPASLVPELSSPLTEVDPSIRFDGLEVFFFSGRPVSFGGIDLWTATRETVLDPWSTPTNLGPLVNTVAQDSQPSIASDRQTLYFASNRAGGFGDLDLYRSKKSQP
jgi:WD40 repeat protein